MIGKEGGLRLMIASTKLRVGGHCRAQVSTAQDRRGALLISGQSAGTWTASKPG